MRLTSRPLHSNRPNGPSFQPAGQHRRAAEERPLATLPTIRTPGVTTASSSPVGVVMRLLRRSASGWAREGVEAPSGAGIRRAASGDDVLTIARELLDRVDPVAGTEFSCVFTVDEDSRTASGLVGRVGRRELEWFPE